MKVFSSLILFFFLTICFASHAKIYAEMGNVENDELLKVSHYEHRIIGKKIYVKPDQIYITDDSGIYIFIQNACFSVQQLNRDEDGIYCLTEHLCRKEEKVTNTCLNGHKIWCWQCYGCNVRYCLSGRCKCVAWE